MELRENVAMSIKRPTSFTAGISRQVSIVISSHGKDTPSKCSPFIRGKCSLWTGREKHWLSQAFCEYKGIEKINGRMFRYLYPLTKEAKTVRTHSLSTSLLSERKIYALKSESLIRNMKPFLNQLLINRLVSTIHNYFDRWKGGFYAIASWQRRANQSQR